MAGRREVKNLKKRRQRRRGNEKVFSMFFKTKRSNETIQWNAFTFQEIF